MDFIRLPLLLRWLFHSLLIWVIMNVYTILSFPFQIKLRYYNGYSYTLFHRIMNLNFRQPTIAYIFITIFLVELNMYLFHRMRLPFFILGTFLTGALVYSMLFFSTQLQNGHIFSFNLLPFFLVCAYAFVYPIVLEFLSRRIIRAETKFEQSSAELNALKAQINPHFLFNTLNSLFGTALREQATDTASGIERLANMMRYVLNEANQNFVPVTLEIKFLEEYLDLQRLRLPEIINGQVRVDISYDKTPVLVAPLLLIPFIENAFKYGVDINQASYVRIKLSVLDRKLDMHIVNSITNINPGSGTGIANARKRLELLYQNRHTLIIQSTSNEYNVNLQIEL